MNFKSTRLILELELEVKLLRSSIESFLPAIEHGDEQHRTWLRTKYRAHFEKALSTPPPALAEAYVRLRDAAKCQLSGWPDHFHYDGPNLETALAAIEKLEKGE